MSTLSTPLPHHPLSTPPPPKKKKKKKKKPTPFHVSPYIQSHSLVLWLILHASDVTGIGVYWPIFKRLDFPWNRFILPSSGLLLKNNGSTLKEMYAGYGATNTKLCPLVLSEGLNIWTSFHSDECQKGVITIQGGSFENQLGAIL